MSYDQVLRKAGYELSSFVGRDSTWLNSKNANQSVHVTDGEWAFYDFEKNDADLIEGGKTAETLESYLASLEASADRVVRNG